MSRPGALAIGLRSIAPICKIKHDIFRCSKFSESKQINGNNGSRSDHVIIFT